MNDDGNVDDGDVVFSSLGGDETARWKDALGCDAFPRAMTRGGGGGS